MRKLTGNKNTLIKVIEQVAHKYPDTGYEKFHQKYNQFNKRRAKNKTARKSRRKNR